MNETYIENTEVPSFKVSADSSYMSKAHEKLVP